MKQTKKSRYKTHPEKLGAIADRFLTQCVIPKQARFRSVEKTWFEILPPELAAHSSIQGLSAGQLIIRVDSPSHKYELQLCSSEILPQLKASCPAARIEKIKIISD
jgi:hypothetical protein